MNKALTPEKLALARLVLEEVLDGEEVMLAVRDHPLSQGGMLGKSALVAAYNEMVATGEILPDKDLLERIRMKPVRTLSGVTTVTVLTKPYPCPGKCIFCPTDVRMPKSYLPDEPGAMRGLEHDFDPYAAGALADRRARSARSSHRQDRTAHPGRHLERLPPRLSGMVRDSAASTR